MVNRDAIQADPLPRNSSLVRVTSRERVQRQRLMVRGIVQGVGFRPFLYSQALRWNLAGFVYNDSTGVTIEVEGSAQDLEHFLHALREEVPPLACIDSIEARSLSPRGETSFTIVHSQAGAERHALISPDTAVC